MRRFREAEGAGPDPADQLVDASPRDSEQQIHYHCPLYPLNGDWSLPEDVPQDDKGQQADRQKTPDGRPGAEPGARIE